jgi:hypothetical protein
MAVSIPINMNHIQPFAMVLDGELPSEVLTDERTPQSTTDRLRHWHVTVQSVFRFVAAGARRVFRPAMGAD